MSPDGHKALLISEELLRDQMIQLDALSQLLIEKGLITEKEFVAKLKQVQYEYESSKTTKG